MTAPAQGRVQRLNVREGQEVHAGQILAVVSTERQSLAGGTAGTVMAQLRAQQERLGVDLEDLNRLETQQGAGLEHRAALLRAQLSAMSAQRDLARQQAANSAALLARIAPLGAKGYISAFEVARQQAAKLETEAQVRALDRQLIELRQQLAAAEDQRVQLPLTSASHRSALERQRAGIEQSMAQVEADRAAVLNAPQSGRVSAVLVSVGQPVGTGQALLVIVPGGSPLEAQLLIPSHAAGFVRPGQRVAIRYAAYAYQKFGLQAGTVQQVTQNALTQAEVGAMLGGQVPPEALYRVRVRLDHQHITAYGRQQPLKPGMALEADLLLERRRLLEWVFEPLYGFAQGLPGDAAKAVTSPGVAR
jgi:membrane fusion protein